MSDVTQILGRIEQGDSRAAAELLPPVYEELRRLAGQKLAQEKPGQTLQATALVHEAYLRLVDVETAQQWNSRGHFFAAAAEAMRRILIENARRKKSDKRGGEWTQIALDCDDAVSIAQPDELLALDETLEKLAQRDPIAGKLVELGYFAGLSLQQAAQVLGISAATAYRHWTFGRAWLHSQLLAEGGEPAS